jgi:ATP-binding cassette subfamily B protein
LKKFKLDHLDPDTVIGERGVLLSGGERQRLVLARAFIFDYDILLLDEPTSNLDPETEKHVLDAIFDRYKDKTIAVISHNDYVLNKVDRIIKMKKGEIVEDIKK